MAEISDFPSSNLKEIGKKGIFALVHPEPCFFGKIFGWIKKISVKDGTVLIEPSFCPNDRELKAPVKDVRIFKEP